MEVLAISSSPRCSLMETACGSLLRELQQIWTEIGETEADKDQMLLELEKECMAVYRRKVNEASNIRVSLHQAVASKEAELASLIAVLGENMHYPQTDKRLTSLKEQLKVLAPLVEELQARKDERLKLFASIKVQIEKITGEIICTSDAKNSVSVDEHDLSLRKLDEYRVHLHMLQKEKSDRLHKILEHVNEVHQLCRVLGLDLAKTVSEVHPSLKEACLGHSTNVNESTLDNLIQVIHKLKMEKKSRVEKLQNVVNSLLDLWNLMDSSEEERNKFIKVTSIMGLPEQEITLPDILSLEMLEQVSAEVNRLNKLKLGRTKELVLKKRAELEEICSMAHLKPDVYTAVENSNALIDSGIVDPSELLATIDSQITNAKEEWLNRKEIMERIGKWFAACEEENWLEEYNQDENRYSAGRGAHINLRRAEKARLLVMKIPAMVDSLMNKVSEWEKEKNMTFLYDGASLLPILEEYKTARQQREEEKKQIRNQKKLLELLNAEREAMYGSKPSPRKTNSFKKLNGTQSACHGSMTPRRLSLSGYHAEMSTPTLSGRTGPKETRRLSPAPLNFVSIAKEDTISSVSGCGSESESPQR